MLIYCVEDDLNIANIIKITLKQIGYEVVHFVDYKMFFNELEKNKPDLVLLDMMLPNIHGLDIIKKIRNNDLYNDIDIMVISADNLLMTKLNSFDLGADDYIEKPFDIQELTLRIKSRFRKKQKLKTKSIYVLDKINRTVSFEKKEILLTDKEFTIIKLLIDNKGEVVTRAQILKELWGSEDGETRVIDMHVKTIRKKLNTDDIETVYGLGYKLIK